ncbi:MAG: hypothetical protein ACRDIE_14280, partial [Chloroflexota bacterium]
GQPAFPYAVGALAQSAFAVAAHQQSTPAARPRIWVLAIRALPVGAAQSRLRCPFLFATVPSCSLLSRVLN